MLPDDALLKLTEFQGWGSFQEHVNLRKCVRSACVVTNGSRVGVDGERLPERGPARFVGACTAEKLRNLRRRELVRVVGEPYLCDTLKERHFARIQIGRA